MAKLLDLDDQRRDAILNASLKEFSSQGYDNASTNVIAKEAGISKALMFHYVSSKQELFHVVYDYFSEVIKKRYYELMNYDEPDIFVRLRQSYQLQIEMLGVYPWILEFHKLSQPANSSEMNHDCYPELFDGIDETKFRTGLNVDLCKQFIFWSNIGFTNQLLDDIYSGEHNKPDKAAIMKKLDGYFEELRKIFYNSSTE